MHCAAQDTDPTPIFVQDHLLCGHSNVAMDKIHAPRSAVKTIGLSDEQVHAFLCWLVFTLDHVSSKESDAWPWLLQVKKLRRMLAVFTLQDQEAVDSFDGSP